MQICNKFPPEALQLLQASTTLYVHVSRPGSGAPANLYSCDYRHVPTAPSVTDNTGCGTLDIHFSSEMTTLSDNFDFRVREILSGLLQAFLDKHSSRAMTSQVRAIAVDKQIKLIPHFCHRFEAILWMENWTIPMIQGEVVSTGLLVWLATTLKRQELFVQILTCAKTPQFQ
jgi:hypothetical protein